MSSPYHKLSLKTSKLELQNLSSLSPVPHQPQKTSTTNPSPRPPKLVTQKRQYQRMKLLFRNSTNQYYTSEIKNILQDEVRKIKQSEKVKVMIETLKGGENKVREKHHERVAQVAEQVKQKDLQKSICALENYLKKREERDTRVEKFIKQKKEQFMNRSLLSQRSTTKQEQAEQSHSTVRFSDTSMTERKKSVIHLRTTTAVNEGKRRQKLRILREKEQGLKISIFMNKMKGMQDVLASKEIQKHQKISEMKKVPVKCLTLKRNETKESVRLRFQKQFNEKNKKAESYLELKQKESCMNNFEKSIRSFEHSRIVGDRRDETNRNTMNMKAVKSQMNFDCLKQRRYQQEAILQMKREFKLRREYEEEHNTKLMRKLVDKISDLKALDPKERLPEEEIHNFERILKQLNDSNTNANTDVFRDTKYSAANKIVLEEEARNKAKKLNKKNH